MRIVMSRHGLIDYPRKALLTTGVYGYVGELDSRSYFGFDFYYINQIASGSRHGKHCDV